MYSVHTLCSFKINVLYTTKMLVCIHKYKYFLLVEILQLNFFVCIFLY